ncbi:MAG: histidine phosphatase family protein [Candidatus Puniceispirillaceae bacterium]
MQIFNRLSTAILICLLVISGGAGLGTAHANTLKHERESIHANIVFMRHALAPGFGDPARFDITDCNSQRNLDAAGRRQARQAGAALARSGIEIYQILSSRWCRCTETAALLELGAFTTFDGLNSFFQNHAPRDAALAKLRQKLDSLSPSAPASLMVTHSVTIRAITGLSVASGGVVIYDLKTGTARELSLSSL